MSNRRAAMWFLVYWFIGFALVGSLVYDPDPRLVTQPMSAFVAPFLVGALTAFMPWTLHINRASERKAKRELEAHRAAGAFPPSNDVTADWGKQS